MFACDMAYYYLLYGRFMQYVGVLCSVASTAVARKS
jgi:hypothetical protein